MAVEAVAFVVLCDRLVPSGYRFLPGSRGLNFEPQNRTTAFKAFRFSETHWAQTLGQTLGDAQCSNSHTACCLVCDAQTPVVRTCCWLALLKSHSVVKCLTRDYLCGIGRTQVSSNLTEHSVARAATFTLHHVCCQAIALFPVDWLHLSVATKPFVDALGQCGVCDYLMWYLLLHNPVSELNAHGQPSV